MKKIFRNTLIAAVALGMGALTTVQAQAQSTITYTVENNGSVPATLTGPMPGCLGVPTSPFPVAILSGQSHSGSVFSPFEISNGCKFRLSFALMDYCEWYVNRQQFILSNSWMYPTVVTSDVGDVTCSSLFLTVLPNGDWSVRFTADEL